MTPAPPAARRGRPRDPAVDAAILDAAIEEIVERGMGGLSMESVALRAGVAKTTVYRRWAGTGDLALRVKPGNRIAYLHLWPHARPWHVTAPEPMMRSVPDAADVSAILARALAAAREVEEEAANPVIRPRARGPRLATAS